MRGSGTRRGVRVPFRSTTVDAVAGRKPVRGTVATGPTHPAHGDIATSPRLKKHAVQRYTTAGRSDNSRPAQRPHYAAKVFRAMPQIAQAFNETDAILGGNEPRCGRMNDR